MGVLKRIPINSFKLNFNLNTMKRFVKNKKWFKTGIFLLAISIIFSCNDKQKDSTKKEDLNKFTISGEIKGLPDSYMYFRMPDPSKEKKYRNDSIQVKDGKFSFSGNIDNYEMLKFWLNVESIVKKVPGGGYFPVKSNNLFLFIFPGADVKVEGRITDFVNAYPSGDLANNDLAKLHKELYPIYNEEGDLMVKNLLEKDKDKKRKIRDSINLMRDKAKAVKKRFITDNPQSIASVWNLSEMMIRNEINEDEAVSIFKTIDPKLSNVSFYKKVEERISAINKTKPGNLVPEIKTTSTVDHTEFDLRSYRGKYVLIDFWGTWCGPCVAEMPKVKSFLEKHKDKMEVLGVNSGDSRKRMTEFLKKNDFHWQQVMNVKGVNDDNFVLKFNVTGFPTKFIIDPEGKIVKKYTGSGEEAFHLLEELLK